jgi:hypothetical protein
MYKDYSVTVQDSVKQISELDPKKKPLLSGYLEGRRNTPVCRGLDFGTYLTSPIKRMLQRGTEEVVLTLSSHTLRNSTILVIIARASKVN